MRREARQCRGFGERRGTCQNSPGVRQVAAGLSDVQVSSLCPTCDRAWRENERAVRKLESVERVRKGVRR